MPHFIIFRLRPVGAIYGAAAIKHKPLISGPERMAVIKSGLRQSAGQMEYTYVTAETMWTIDLGEMRWMAEIWSLFRHRGNPGGRPLYCKCDAMR